MTDEEIVIGWEGIAKFFPMITKQTVMRKYGKEMLDCGYAFKTLRSGKYKSPRVWSFPSFIKAYISKKQSEEGHI